MALLTADDIRYRKFAPTRFREGYDVDEVDDFLEEVIHTVDELTRLAQSSATNTGSFQALKPLVTDPETSPVFQDLQREKDGLAAQVKELEEKLKEAQNAPAPVISETGETQVSDEKTQQLYADNQELAQHLQNAEMEIAHLKQQVADSANNLPVIAPDNSEEIARSAEKIANLNSELSALRHDYEELSNQKSKLDSRLDEFNNNQGASADVFRLQSELEQVQSKLDESNTVVEKLKADLAEAKTPKPILESTGNPGEAAGMLSMAQQLHDEYIEKGKNDAGKIVDEAKKEKLKLVDEGQNEHDRLVQEGTKERERLVTEAQKKADDTYAKLAAERGSIEEKIDELRIFERDYRKKLTKFLKGMLDEVDANDVLKSDQE